MNAIDDAPHDVSDEEVWDDYRRTRSEAAFRRLVERHLPLVWAVARRAVAGERPLAEDVAQIVFADLARLAPRLPERFGIGGWLHRHTFFTASKAVRAEVRRRAREHTAATMQTTTAHPPGPDSLPADVARHLDAALAALAPRDREVIVLRYLQERSMRDVGIALGLTEETARKRVSRALEKLRVQLRRHGVTAGSAAVGSALAAQAPGAAPAALAAHIATGAWTLHVGAAGAGGLGAWLAGLATPVAVASARWGARSLAAAGAGAFLATLTLAGGAWWGHARGKGVPEIESTTPRLVHPATGAATAASHAAAVSGEVRFDLFLLPKSSLAHVRLLQFRPGVDDAELHHDLGTPDASSGMSFTVPLRGRGSGRFEETEPFEFATEFDPRPDDLPEPAAHETRAVGTLAQVEVEVAGRDDVPTTTFVVEHHRAAPSTVSWPVSSQPGDDRAVGHPQFHPVRFVGACATPPGEPVLAALSLLPAPGGADFSAPQSYALLFITFQPDAHP